MRIIIFAIIFLISCQQPTTVSPPIDVPQPIFIPDVIVQPPQYLTWKCNDYCIAPSTHFTLTYNTSKDEFICKCLSENTTIQMTMFPNHPDPINDAFNTTQLHWTHMPVTFSIDTLCGEYETRQVQRAFLEIENETVVSFKEVNENEDITITCSYLKDCYKKVVDVQEEFVRTSESICPHNGGSALISQTRGPQILHAEIELIGLDGFAETHGKEMSGFFIGTCGHRNTEIHEILHTFAFEHVNDPLSIMSPTQESFSYSLGDDDACIGSRRFIDDSIINRLEDIYS